MKNKLLIILRGLGGNFKSAIAKELVHYGFIMIPEGHREFEKVLSEFDRISDVELGYCAKHIMIEAFLKNDFEKYVSDRGLVDQALMNQFIKEILEHYSGCESEHLDVEKVYQEECKLFNGYRVVNVLLETTDIKFLEKIIDNSFDARACLFEYKEYYLECQEAYKEFVLSHYNNVIRIKLDKVPDLPKYSEGMNQFVKELTTKILSEINEK